MINKKELSKLIGQIGYEILDEIIAPVCGIEGIIADLYLADMACYTMGDEENEKKIIDKIIERYKLYRTDAELIIDSSMPIALIVLFILENGEYSQK